MFILSIAHPPTLELTLTITAVIISPYVYGCRIMFQVFCARDAGNINVKIPCFTDSREVAPLHLAAENGHVETVIALLDQFKADISLQDSDRNTALHCVVLQPYHPYRMRDRDFFYATAKASFVFHVCFIFHIRVFAHDAFIEQIFALLQ